MGWLFGHYDRRSLVEHLVNGNEVKTLKKCFRGNDMWAVQETKDGIVFACLYMLRGNPRVKNDGYNWGYKDVDETMGPCRTDFPATWLDLLSPTDSQYANDWRAAVRARADELKRLKIGTTWERADGSQFTILARRSPSSLRVKDAYGDTWRMSPRSLLGAKEIRP